ncbi:MAG: UvrD-helicase domain-containing protein [Gammaproteobacteria bacterium]|nr:UvrD-helicase domain-containing protein [Gammaproteobacteria bacterium]
MSDSVARLQALDPLDSFIVEAPAGSGKTDLLVKRYLKLLETVERPEEILAITFTRKAAHEMQERIAKAQGEAHLNPNIQVMTIDSFCRVVVNQAPLTSPVLTAEMLEDEAVLKQAFLAALLNVIEKQDEGSVAFCALFQYFDNQLLMVTDLLFDLLKSREEWLPIVLGAKHHGNAFALQETCVKKLHAAAWQEWQNLKPASYRASFGDETNLKGIADRVLTQKDEVRKCIKEPVPLEFLDFLIKVRHLPEWEKKEDSLLPILLEVLPLAAAYLQMVLHENQWTDFHDIALSAVHLLETDPEIMQRMDTKIKHILVDEFQDTSNLQFRLLKALTTDWQSQDGRTLFLVGDPKQSIYGFRNANVGLFLQARSEGIGAIKLTPLLLRRNFRSDPKIVHFINRAGQQMFPPEADSVLGKVQFMESEPQRDFPDAQGVQQHFFADPMQEAKSIVRHISTIQKSKSNESIAILVRARSHFSEIILALNQANIPYSIKKDQHWLNAPLVDDLMNLIYSPCLDGLAALALLWLDESRSS